MRSPLGDVAPDFEKDLGRESSRVTPASGIDPCGIETDAGVDGRIEPSEIWRSDVTHTYLRALAPHDHTTAGSTIWRVQHKFSGAKKYIGGDQLSARIRSVNNLALHARTTVIEDDQSLL